MAFRAVPDVHEHAGSPSRHEVRRDLAKGLVADRAIAPDPIADGQGDSTVELRDGSTPSGEVAPTSPANDRADASPSSIAIPISMRPSAVCSRWVPSRSDISVRHGTHQLGHRLSQTDRPRKSERRMGVPSRLGASKSGARSPTSVPMGAELSEAAGVRAAMVDAAAVGRLERSAACSARGVAPDGPRRRELARQRQHQLPGHSDDCTNEGRQPEVAGPGQRHWLRRMSR